MQELPVSTAAPLEPARGRLKVYLGATAGSGKTFAMLNEGRERRSHGEDVVVGFVETHGRPRTAEAVGSLEVIPRVKLEYRGTRLEEMDVDAVLRRNPHVALVDELAHSNVPGARNAKRWQDIDELRAAGIDVITTVNVQHLESVKDIVEGITGITIRETLPDRIIDSANEIRFIDITPEALRKRMRHGNIYPQERVDTALSNFFRPGNLAALRELGLRVVADHIDIAAIDTPPEDVLVAVSGEGGSEALIRRAARIARHNCGACTVLYVERAGVERVEDWEAVARQLECPIISVTGRSRRNVAEIILRTARTRSARHLVVGESRHRNMHRVRRGVVDAVVDNLVDCDLHVIARYSAWRSPEVRSTPEELLAKIQPPTSRGELRIYLGYAPGCGATTTVLAEASRRHGRGTDVLIAELKGRIPTDVPLLGGRSGRGAHGKLDLDALLSRNPDVCVIDDLASQTTEDEPIVDVVPRILDAGITVLGTICLGDLASVVDGLQSIADVSHGTGRLDDRLLDEADEVELVDVTPEELQERVRNGAVLPMSDAARALQGPYRIEVLQALREMAFRRLTALSDKHLLAYMDEASIATAWEARPRILVCVAPRAGANLVVEKAARRASARGDALTVLSIRGKHHDDQEKRILGEYAALTHRLGGEFVSVHGLDVVDAIANYARTHRITEIVLLRGSGGRARVLRRVIRALCDIDVHIIVPAA